MKKEIKMLVGPASIGKTTYAREAGYPPDHTVFISRDDIVDRLTDKYNYTYNELFLFPPAGSEIDSIVPGFEKYGKVIETPEIARHISPISYETLNAINSEIHHTYYNEFQEAIDNPHIQTIFLDRVHMLKRERSVYFPFIEKNRDTFKVTAIIFNFQDADTMDIISSLAEKRRKKIEETGRFKTIPRNIQQGMIDRYEEVSPEEGFDEIKYVDTLPKLRKILANG